MSSWKQFNNNPNNNIVGDCVIRALSVALNQDWEKTYAELCMQGFLMGDMPSSNAVWGAYLKNKGFDRYVIPNTCPDCYTISNFCDENPQGTYILGTGTHVVAVIDGTYIDTWNSGGEVPIYYFEKKNEEVKA